MGRDGVVSGIYTGNRRFTGRCTFDQGVGNITVKKDSQIWYVDSGKTSPAVSGDGLSPEGAFLTLAEAITAAGNYDVILIAENSIQTIAATGLTITQTGLKIFGSNNNPGIQASALKCTGTAPMFTIKADRVEIAGLCLSQRGAYACIMIGDTAGQAYYQTYIHDCNFDGYNTATYGISPGPVAAAANSQADAVNLVVENCFFKGHVTAAIVSNGTRDAYRDNVIHVPADAAGIYVYKTSGDRGYGVVDNNIMFGEAGTTTIGIKGAGNNTPGLLIYSRNLFVGDFDTTISNNSGDPGVLNYYGSTTGGSLIDCNSSA
jgi:hypothetical protein